MVDEIAIRILSYNLLSEESILKKSHFRHVQQIKNRQAVQVELILSFNPDLLALQEYNPVNCDIVDQILEERGYRLIKQQREHFHINVIAVKKTRFKVIWEQRKRSRAVTVALEDKLTNKTFLVTNVHLDALDAEARINQLVSYQKIAYEYVHSSLSVECQACNRKISHLNLSAHNVSSKHLANGGEPLTSEEQIIPIIWLGDFNVTPNSPEWLFMSEVLGLRHAYYDHFNPSSKYATHWSGRMVDHVFYQPLSFKSKNALDTRSLGFTNEVNPSDHLPIVVDLVLT